MKRVSKSLIVSISILGIFLLTVGTLLLSLDMVDGSSHKSIIFYEPLNNYQDYNTNFRGEYSLYNSPTTYGGGSSNYNPGREITEPIVNSAPIGPGAIQAPRTSAPIGPGAIQAPRTSAPIGPGAIQAPGNYAPINQHRAN